MRPAVQYQVRHRSPPAVRPVFDVMCVGPLRWPVATVGDAAAIALGQGPPGRRWNGATGFADFAGQLAAAGDPAQGGVAGQPANRLRRDRPPAVELAGGGIAGTPQGVNPGPDDPLPPGAPTVTAAGGAAGPPPDQTIGAGLSPGP